MLKHGGLISAVSGPGSGSVFTLHFPALSAEAQAVESGQPALAAGSGRVLVMDDGTVVTTVVFWRPETFWPPRWARSVPKGYNMGRKFFSPHTREN